MKHVRLGVTALFTFVLGCGGGGGGDAGGGGSTGIVAAVQGVSMSSATAQVTVGSTVALTASVSATGGAPTGVNWSTSNSAVATVSAGTISGVSVGTATITATSQFDPSKSASATITVIAPPTPSIVSVTSTSLIVSAAPQTITVTGTNFQPGMTLTIVKPRFAFSNPQVLGPAQLQSVTSTSFQVSASLSMLGDYTFQVETSGGIKSNVLTASAQFRTSGATWIPEGVRITGETIGFPNTSVADVVAIHLQDGRWRLIFNSSNSVISPDGVTMTRETPFHGMTGATPDGSVARLTRIFTLPDGRIRAFFGCCGSGLPAGIYSAVTSDEGVTWTPESGARILLSATGTTLSQAFLTGLSVVPIAGGRWRGYFSDQSAQTFPETPVKIYSATSTDLLTWTMDPGARIGAGAALSGAGSHAKAIVNANGSVTLFYYRLASPQGLYASTSTDGLTFTSETLLESLGQGGDPDVVQVGSALRMYYNWGDNTGGAIYSAISASGAPAIRQNSTPPKQNKH